MPHLPSHTRGMAPLEENAPPLRKVIHGPVGQTNPPGRRPLRGTRTRRHRRPYGHGEHEPLGDVFGHRRSDAERERVSNPFQLRSDTVDRSVDAQPAPLAFADAHLGADRPHHRWWRRQRWIGGPATVRR